MSAPALIVASKSPARRALLQSAGVPIDCHDAAVDETALKRAALAENLPPETIATTLAEAKASVLSAKFPDGLVLGCDQILAQGNVLYDKPETIAEARHHLQSFSGRSHKLISAAVLIRGGRCEWRHLDTATMHVRRLSDAFIDDYLHNEDTRVLTSVGAYRLEGLGVQLFEAIEGNYFTILGLPLVALLEELRKRGILSV